MQLWLDNDQDRTSFWLHQGGVKVATMTSSAGTKRSADLKSWITEAQTRIKRQKLIAPRTRYKF